MRKAMTINITAILGFATFFLVLFLIDLYVFKGVKTVFSNSSFPIKRTADWLYWLVNVAFILCAIYVIATLSYSPKHTPFMLEFVLAAFVLLYVPKLIFGAFLLGEDVYRILRAAGIGVYKLTASSNSPVEFFESRRKFVSQFATIVAGVPF